MSDPPSNSSSPLTRIVESLSQLKTKAKRACLRGVYHRQRLTDIDIQITISGTRGKSSLTKWIYEILYARDYDVYAKVTGNRPLSLHSGDEEPVSRGSRVTLYENEREIRKHTPQDALIIENQAITSYTTRLVNKSFVDSDVIVISNIREDHLSTLGGSRYKVARGLVRAIPSGVHVVNGERDPQLRAYLDRELKRRGATVTHVTVPEEYDHIPGIESVYALNEILDAINEEPLSEDELAAYREKMDVEWRSVAGGRVYNAAEVNDVQSTELIRQALFAKDPSVERIEPFLYLRGDRRGRTVSFLHYLNELYAEDDPVFDQVHVAGQTTEAFARKATFPVTSYDSEVPAEDVLARLLTSDRPVFIMGNTVAQFMRELQFAIEEREEMAESSAESVDDNQQAENTSETTHENPTRHSSGEGVAVIEQ